MSGPDGRDDRVGALADDHRKAELHVEALRRHFESIEARGEPLQRRAGQPNRSAIAAACGMHRQVLYQNPDCRRMLEEFDAEDRARHLTMLERAEAAREATDKAGLETLDLRAEVLRLQAEVASLRAELERYARLEAIMCATGKLP